MIKKETKKIEKQIVSRIMIGLIFVLIFSMVSSTIFILNNFSKLSNSAFETVSIGIQNSVEKVKFEDFLLSKTGEESEYLEFVSDLEKYRDI